MKYDRSGGFDTRHDENVIDSFDPRKNEFFVRNSRTFRPFDGGTPTKRPPAPAHLKPAPVEPIDPESRLSSLAKKLAPSKPKASPKAPAQKGLHPQEAVSDAHLPENAVSEEAVSGARLPESAARKANAAAVTEFAPIDERPAKEQLPLNVRLRKKRRDAQNAAFLAEAKDYGDYGITQEELDAENAEAHSRTAGAVWGIGFGKRDSVADDRSKTIFGGAGHDNLHAPDMRPKVKYRRLTALACAAILLLICVPGLLKLWNERTALGSGIRITTSNATSVTPIPAVPTPEPTATPEPTLQPNTILSRYTGRMLYTDKPYVALTFDNGPSDYTREILDALEAAEGLATFFPIGERMESYASVIRRASEMGCLIGTHGYTNRHLAALSAEELASEKQKCFDAHISLLGQAPQVWRVPFNETDEALLTAFDLPAFGWSLDSTDWELQNADRIYEKIMDNVKSGDIVRFYDLKEFTANAVARIILSLTSEGYQFVTVQELLELSGIEPQSGTVYNGLG